MIFFVRPLLVFLIVLFLGSSLMGCGEKYTEQGNALAQEINRELIGRGLCKNSRDCFDLLPMYGEHGDQVYFNFYGVNAGNRRAFTIVIELVMSRGMEITKGVPITIQAFPKPHEEYVNNFSSKKPVLKLEVTI